MHPFSIKKLLMLLGLLGSTAAALAEDPPWKEIQSAAQAHDFPRLESWIRNAGVQSGTAANVLIAAAECGDRSMVEQLLAQGISPNVTNLNGVSALWHVAQNGHAEMARLLLQRGANPNHIQYCTAADCKGHTLLLDAACRQDLRMAKVFLEAGADPRAAEDSAIQTANMNGDVELFLLLKQFGARENPGHPPEGTASASGAKSAELATPFAALGLTGLLAGKANFAIPPATKSKGRLSVIADDANVALADLLAAQLSAEPLLEIVERQELDRILSEQKLTRQFAVNSANYGRIADLLRADALLLINQQMVAGKKVVESRLIRVNPGLVLDTVYSAAPIASPAEWAERMRTRVTGLAGKVTRHDAIALSLLNVRASVSSSASRGLDRTLAVLLSDRLAHQNHFVILERSAMERLVSENASQFWTGSYLVDGTLEPALDGSGTFALAVRFQPSVHGETLTFSTSGKRADPAAAVDDLLTKINTHFVGAQAPARRDLAGEAHSYLDEAKWALEAEQPALAQSAAEAAWALDLRTLDVARLRVLTAMRAVRDLRDPGLARSSIGLDLGMHGLTVWREMLESELVRGRPEDLRKWLEFGLEMTDGAILALIRIDTAAEQVRHAERLELLRDLTWTSLEEIWARSAGLPTGTGIGNAASEKQAGVARLLFPHTAQFLPAARNILARKFTTNDALTRARIRANLISHWNLAQVMVQTTRTTGGSVNLRLSMGEEASQRLASELRNSPAAEDRYVSALLAIWTASLHQEATPEHLERLRTSLFDMDKLLAEGGEVFGLYWERFEALDKLNGVPFFAINRTFSSDRKRMWERHTPEHTEFRRQLFLRICPAAKAPASDFAKLVSLDEYTPEQVAEVHAAQSRLRATGPNRPATVRNESVFRSPAGPPSESVAPQPPGGGAPPLEVRRLWTPYNLGLEIPPTFRADYVTMTWAEGRIWLHGCTLDQGGQPDRHYLFAIEPGSLRTETIPIPERSSKLNGRIMVSSSHLAFVCQDFLAVRDRASGRWETYKEIQAADINPPALLGDSVYLIVAEPPGNALIGFDLKLRTAEVLASTRRRPAASPFDDPGLVIKSVATNELGELVVAAGSIKHVWSPPQRSWRPVPPQPSVSGSSAKPQPGRLEFGRVGTVLKVNGNVVLRFLRKDASVNDIPLAFARPAGDRLPQSFSGPQNIRPDYCNSFRDGLLLVPSTGSGFWVILQKEMDDYVQQSTVASKPAQSAAN